MYKGIGVFFVLLLGVGAFLWFVQDPSPEPVDLEEVGYEQAQERVEEVDHEDVGDSVSDEQDVEEVDDVLENDEPMEDPAMDSGEAVQESAVEGGDEAKPVESLPDAFNLAVPFTPQAPHANWELPYQEACEEASAYMVAMYYQGVSGRIAANEADEALLDLVDFQNTELGKYLDTTAEETRWFMDAFYGTETTVVDDPTVEQIQAEIAAGRPVIVPAAGKQLHNPYFSGDGPLYHMFVIKGYTDSSFIVHDPGTKRGQDYQYSIDTVMQAMGDWNDGDPANGAKRVIFTAP